MFLMYEYNVLLLFYVCFLSQVLSMCEFLMFLICALTTDAVDVNVFVCMVI